MHCPLGALRRPDADCPHHRDQTLQGRPFLLAVPFVASIWKRPGEIRTDLFPHLYRLPVHPLSARRLITVSCRRSAGLCHPCRRRWKCFWPPVTGLGECHPGDHRRLCSFLQDLWMAFVSPLLQTFKPRGSQRFQNRSGGGCLSKWAAKRGVSHGTGWAQGQGRAERRQIMSPIF